MTTERTFELTQADIVAILQAFAPTLTAAISTALQPNLAEYAKLRMRLDALDEHVATLRGDVLELQHAVDPSDRVPESALQG